MPKKRGPASTHLPSAECTAQSMKGKARGCWAEVGSSSGSSQKIICQHTGELEWALGHWRLMNTGPELRTLDLVIGRETPGVMNTESKQNRSVIDAQETSILFFLRVTRPHKASCLRFYLFHILCVACLGGRAKHQGGLFCLYTPSPQPAAFGNFVFSSQLPPRPM